MSRSDTIFLDRSVTFRHNILGSEYHVPTRYSWIGVSRSDTIFLDRSVTFRHDNIKEKHVELMEGTQTQRTQLPKWFGLEAWVLMCDFDIIDLLHTYFSVVDTVDVVCCLSPIECHSWFYTIIPCALILTLGWPMRPTQYMFPSIKPYLCFSLFFIYGVDQVYWQIWLPLSYSKSRHIRFKGELFIRAWVGFSQSLPDVLSYRTQITLFYLFYFLWYS